MISHLIGSSLYLTRLYSNLTMMQTYGWRDSWGNSVDGDVGVFMAYLELLAERSYFKHFFGEDAFKVFSFALNASDEYDDRRRRDKYDKPGFAQDCLLCDTPVAVDLVMANLRSFVTAIGPQDKTYYHYDYETEVHPDSLGYQIKVTRSFVQQMYLLGKSTLETVLFQYFAPIARGHIREKCKFC